MKTTSLLIMLMLVLSCVNQETTEENKVEQDEFVISKRPTLTINAQEVFFRSAIAETNTLTQRQEEIISIFEHDNGDNNLEREYEENNDRIEKLHTFTNLLIGIIGPIGPIPIPPDGCFDTARGLNCTPTQNLANVNDIIIFNDVIEINSIQIFDRHNEQVGEATNVYTNEYNQKVMRLEHHFEHESTMKSTLYVSGLGEITINTPVIID